ncbi:MAG: alpha-2-macroglobulin family protein [Candidatus Kapaibacterium sp.]
MRIITIFILIVLSSTLIGYAADFDYPAQWKEVEELRIKDQNFKAAKLVKTIYAAARLERNEQQIIKSASYRIGWEKEINEKGDVQLVQNLRLEIDSAISPLSRAIFRYLLGEVYWNYALENDGRIKHRYFTNDTLSSDYTTWSMPSLIDTAYSYYMQALTADSILQSALVSQYEMLCTKQEQASLYRPTLYDILAASTIKFLEWSLDYKHSPSHRGISDSALVPVSTYLQSSLYSTQQSGTKNRDYMLELLRLYHQLLSFHSHDDDKTALLTYEIQRLKFIRTKSQKKDADSLYMNALRSDKTTFSNGASSALLSYAIADQLNKNDNLTEAVAYCDQAIHDFPTSQGAINCRVLQSEIRKKELSVAMELNNAPGRPILTSVNYRNIKKIYCRIVKVPSVDHLGEMLRNSRYHTRESDVVTKILHHPLHSNWNIALPSSEDYRRHTVDIRTPPLPFGVYYLVVSPSEDFILDSSAIAYTPIIVTRLSMISQNRPDGSKMFMVQDLETGKPINEVKATLIAVEKNEENQSYTEEFLAQRTTNNRGEFVVTAGEFKNKQYCVDLSKDESVLISFNQFEVNEKIQAKDQIETLFFTDRKIYRPGQLIYFKGIMYKSNRDKASKEILINHHSTVSFREIGGNVIEKRDLQTNEFGSFTGSFLIPTTGWTGTKILENESGKIMLEIEEYKRPTFEVALLPITGKIFLNQRVQLVGLAKGYAGTNCSGAQVKYTITRTFINSDPALRYKDRGIRSRVIIDTMCSMNAFGEFTITFTTLTDSSIITNPDSRYEYYVHATVTDFNGESHTCSTTVVAAAVSVNLALQLGIRESTRNYYEKYYSFGDEDITSYLQNFDRNMRIISTSLNAHPISVRGTIRIERLLQPRQDRILFGRVLPIPDQFILTKEEFETSFPNQSTAIDEDPAQWNVVENVFSGEFQTDASGELITGDSMRLQPGMYRVTITATDDSGAELTVSRHSIIYAPSIKTPPLRKAFISIPQHLTCSPGEQATFMIGTSYDSAYIRYQIHYRNMIVDEGRFEEHILTLSNEIRQFSIPIEEKHRGGFTVLLTMVREQGCYSVSYTVDVPWSNKKLSIETDVFRDTLRPGSKERWRLKIESNDGSPAVSEVVARLYDTSLDAIRSNKWEEFYWENSYSNFQVFGNSFRLSESELYASNWNSDYTLAGITYTMLRLKIIFGWTREFYWIYMDGMRHSENKDTRGQIGTMRSSGEESQVLTSAFSSEYGNVARENDNLTTKKSIDYSLLTSRVINQKPLVGPDPGMLPPEDLTTVKARTNFNETAFFYPQLLTDSSGAVILDFTIPEALTRWKMTAFAHTADLQTGTIERTVVTQKDLMLEPNMPRFMRVGDTMTLPVKITNLTKNALKGAVELTLLDAFTMKPVSAEFGIGASARLDFSAPATNATTVQWRVIIPENYQAIVYRIAAKSGDFSDGEEAPIPILPNRMLVTESIPMWVSNVAGGGNSTKKFTMEKLKQSASSPTLKHHKLTLEMTSNPAWYAIQALPSLMEFPHECAEQIFNRFYANSIAGQLVTSKPRIKQVFDAWKSSPDALSSNLEKNQELKSLLLEETPWVLQGQNETERKKRVALFFDLNRMSNEQAIALNKLSKMQLPNGAFAWFSGMSESSFITNYILAGFGHLNVLGVKFDNPTVKKITSQALFFSDKSMNEDYERLKAIKDFSKKGDYLGSTAIQYLYARSYFTETKMSNQYDEAFDFWKEQAKAHWQKRGLMEQAMIALALKRLDIKGTPEDIITSLNERSLTSDELGMYWKENKSGWLWQEAPIETQAILMEAFDEITGNSKAVELMKVWLLKQKQVQDWATTKATAEACYALLRRGADWLESSNLVNITVGGKTLDPKSDGSSIEAGTGYFKTSWSGKEITPNMSDITLTKTDKGIAWGGLYWQYYEQLNRITPHASPLSLSRTIYRKNLTSNGVELAVISPSSPLKVGDEIVIKLELRTDRDMEFIHLKDMRGSGFEPTIQLSGYKYQDGLGYFQSPRDGSMNFFISSMSKGTYVLEYPLRVTHEGVFSAGISTLQSMYAPEFSSHSQGDVVRVGK